MHWLVRSFSFSKAQGLRETGPRAGLLIIARCYDNHRALLMHITSLGLGYSTQPPFRHGDHDHHDEMEAGLDFYAGTIA